MKRFALVFATAGVGLGIGCCVALAAGSPPSRWSWLLGQDLSAASIGQLEGADDVYVGAYYGGSVPAEVSGSEVVNSDEGGYFEFEHSAAAPNSVFLAETRTGEPTPITIGKVDGQDITPLIVSGSSDMTTNLQSWQLGGAGLSGIDSQGRLRLNGIVLEPTVRNGRIRLEAVLPDGSTQILVPIR